MYPQAMAYDGPPHAMSLDVMPTYYGYGVANGGNGNVRVGYAQYGSMQQPQPSEFSAPPDHDLQVSWQNFMSQYKSI